MVASVTDTSFLTTDQYADQQLAALSGEDELGRDAFLTLLTTQLTNQNPLDPMDNEAFVAQLAQFSSVEGIKGMQGSLESMVTGMRQDQMLTGANLVGKKVAVEGGFFEGGNGAQSQGSIDLPNGAESVILSVYDPSSGELVFRETEHMLINEQWQQLDKKAKSKFTQQRSALETKHKDAIHAAVVSLKTHQFAGYQSLG